MEIEFTQAARRHKIGRERARYVIENRYIEIRQPAPKDSPLQDDRLVFLGDDHTGRALEVVAVELEDNKLLVLHAMDLRDKWRSYYEQGRTQQ